MELDIGILFIDELLVISESRILHFLKSGKFGCVGTHSLPLSLITSVKPGKLPAMYNCV